MFDPVLAQLCVEVSRTRAEYKAAVEALLEHCQKRVDQLVCEERANPVTLAKVRELAHNWLHWTAASSLTSEALARELEAYAKGRRIPHFPSAKTLQNVYLPALREDFPHAIKSGGTWLWYWNAKQGAV